MALEDVVIKLTSAVLVASCSICGDMMYDAGFRSSMYSITCGRPFRRSPLDAERSTTTWTLRREWSSRTAAWFTRKSKLSGSEVELPDEEAAAAVPLRYALADHGSCATLSEDACVDICTSQPSFNGMLNSTVRVRRRCSRMACSSSSP